MQVAGAIVDQPRLGVVLETLMAGVEAVVAGVVDVGGEVVVQYRPLAVGGEAVAFQHRVAVADAGDVEVGVLLHVEPLIEADAGIVPSRS